MKNRPITFSAPEDRETERIKRFWFHDLPIKVGTKPDLMTKNTPGDTCEQRMAQES